MLSFRNDSGHFEMSASTAVSPPKSKVGLTSADEEAGARKQIRFFGAKRSAFATEKANGQREGSRLS